MKPEMSKQTRGLASVVAPLKTRESQAAVKAAQAHVAKELSDHFRILGAELRIDKPPDPAKKPRRIVSVLVADYGSRRNLEVLVDTRGGVVQVNDLRGPQPAYSAEEIAEARQIAEQDSRVRALARTKGLFVSDFGPERAADNARRVGLRYAVVDKGGKGRLLAHAVVDLSAGKLTDFDQTAGDTQPRR